MSGFLQYMELNHQMLLTFCLHCDGQTENELREVWTEWQMHREWRRAEVSLRNLRNFILIFEVVRTQDVSGGAALDELQFIDCAPCKFFFFMQIVLSNPRKF